MASVRGVIAVLLLAFLVLFLALAIVPGIMDFALGREPEAVPLSPELLWFNILTQVVFFFVVPVAYLLVSRPDESAARLLGLRVDARTPRMILAGIGAAIAGVVALAAALIVLQDAGYLTEPQSPLIGELGELVRAHPEFVIIAPLAAGLFEETLFRGFLQPRIGLLGSNLVFGLVHLSYGTVLQVLVPFVLGLALGGLYKWTRTLWAPVAAHATFDLIQFLLLLYA